MTQRRWWQPSLRRILSVHWFWRLSALLAGQLGKLRPDSTLVAKMSSQIHLAAIANGYLDSFRIDHRGTRVHLPLLDAGWSELYFRGQSRPPAYRYESDLFDFAESWLQPGDCVFDVGANVGLFSLFCAGLVGHDGTVVAFEPNPEISPLLLSNCAQNPRGAVVETNRLALGSEVGPIRLAFPGWITNQGTASLVGLSPLSDHTRTCEVNMTTIDTFLSTRGPTHIRLFKADVEGAELLVVKGATEALERGVIEALVLEFNRDILSEPEQTWREWSRILVPLGYCPTVLGNEAEMLGPKPPSAAISNVVWKR